jgi:hypothetical protein
MIDQGTCVLYELFGVRRNGGNPTAGSGAIFDLHSNALRPAGWTSADAAGLPIFPGLVRYDEVFGPNAGIHHALRFTVGCTRRSYVWPARHQAGVANPGCPPMGARFRLRAGYDVTGYSTRAQIVLRAMKRYGMIVARQRQRLVLPGGRGSPVELLVPRSAETGARGSLRGGGRVRVQGGVQLRRVRLRTRLPRPLIR